MTLCKCNPAAPTEKQYFWSHSLNYTKCDYENTHSNCLTVYGHCGDYFLYLDCCLTTIQTDHVAKDCIVHLTNVAGKLVCWRLRLTESERDIDDCWNIQHETAYALYRLETTGIHQTMMLHKIPVPCKLASIPSMNGEVRAICVKAMTTKTTKNVLGYLYIRFCDIDRTTRTRKAVDAYVQFYKWEGQRMVLSPSVIYGCIVRNKFYLGQG